MVKKSTVWTYDKKKGTIWTYDKKEEGTIWTCSLILHMVVCRMILCISSLRIAVIYQLPIGMTIGPKPIEYPQKIPTMDR